jgi:cytochrome c oxidase subunit 4
MLRDDIIEYSLEGHHDEAAGKKIRKKIYFVTILLTVITAVEVAIGSTIHQDSSSWWMVKWLFIILTLLKAGYIVLVFMHLGDERKVLKYFILAPYFAFMAYLIFIALYEATAIGEVIAAHGV